MLRRDERLCSPQTPWRGDEEDVVVYHVGTVQKNGLWVCETCGERAKT